MITPSVGGATAVAGRPARRTRQRTGTARHLDASGGAAEGPEDIVFQLLWILLIGFILGVLAKLLLRGPQSIPWWLTMLLGAGGALLGNAVAGWIGVAHTSGIDWTRHALQIGFAVLLVAVVAPAWGRRGVSR
ncbi:GlsB/YeaQ/YmgE family stress response membrane protein [Kitasatospora sp. NPDC057015]|uniref:GlsB/YeaQ/YmgE family stress response membrane protein n=1 Tax=Kitasatospora sp. NPDC057015 TaxID=3346001 RepID=UPI00363C16F5